LARNDLICQFHRRFDRGFQEEVTMLELFILAAGLAGGYVASIVSWPSVRARAIGASAEISRLRARANALEDSIKGGV
jgi:membrane associated rhomboid family serine protease